MSDLLQALGINIIDEPESIGLTAFADTGEVLLTFNARPGSECGQSIIGLTPNQAVQLIEYLQRYNDVYLRAIADGKGGARFKDHDK